MNDDASSVLEGEVLEAVVTSLEESGINLQFAYIFGSVARGDERPNSDVDFAVAADGSLEAEQRFRLAGRLEQILGRPVDVLDLADAGPVLKMQVLKHGDVVVCHDDRALAEFEMYTPAIYEDWRHLSRPFQEALVRQFEP